MRALRDYGIILRRIDYGEADRIITFLTREHGKLRAIAKGVRKQKSKLAGGIELFSMSELQYIKGRGEIDTITSTRLKVNYGDIVKDIERTELAYLLIRVIDKTVEDHTGSEYFPVLNESLASLNDSRISPLLTELSFTLRVLQLLGAVPNFMVGPNGDRLDPELEYEFDFESVAFTPKPGGVYSKNHLKVLKLFAHNAPQAMASVKGIDKYSKDVMGLVRAMRAQSLNL